MKNVKRRCLWRFRDDKQVLDWRNSIPKSKYYDKNVAATITHNDHKDDVLNQKCLRHSINRIQCKIIE